MILINTALGFSEEYESAKAELEKLRSDYSALLEEYTHLITVVRTNLETQYMITIGRKEHALFAIQVEILRYKREIELYRMATNRGETLTADEAQQTLAREFASYKAKLDQQMEDMKKAEAHFTAKQLEPEKQKVLKEVFHKLVKKLHPDLNPTLPPAAKSLWNKVMTAYNHFSWEELFLYSDMADELLKNGGEIPEESNTMTAIQKQIATLQTKSDNLKNKLEETKSCPPFSYEELLSSPSKMLQKRQELEKQIHALEETKQAMYEILEQLKRDMNNG